MTAADGMRRLFDGMSGEDETIRRALLEGGRCHAKHYGTFDFSPAHDALGRLAAVVATQREALRRIKHLPYSVIGDAESDLRFAKDIAAAALDAEGVSEHVPWESCSCDRTYHDECPDHGIYGAGLGPSGKLLPDPRRATSPVDTAPRTWPTTGTGADPRDVHRVPFRPTSPVDAAPCDGSSDCEATAHIHGCFAEVAAPEEPT